MKKEILGPAIVVGLVLLFIGFTYLQHAAVENCITRLEMEQKTQWDHRVPADSELHTYCDEWGNLK